MPDHRRPSARYCRSYPWRRSVAGVLLTATVGLSSASCGTPFQREERLTLTAPLPAQKLVIDNRFGDVAVCAEPGATQVRAEVVKTGKGATLADAEAALRAIEVGLEAKEGEPGTVAAWAHHPQGNSWRNYAVEWHVTTPPDLPVEVSSRFGDLQAHGLTRGVVLRSAFGDLQAEAAGKVELSTDFGKIALHLLPDNPADVVAGTDFGDVTVRIPSNRTGRLAADTDFGSLDLRLEGITTQRLSRRGRYCEMELGGAPQPGTDLSTNFGDVTVRCYDVTRSTTAGGR